MTSMPSSSASSPSSTSSPPMQLLPASDLWEIQRAWYERSALDAYKSSTLAHWISSNSFIAARYANLCIAYAQDCWGADAARANSNAGDGNHEPIHIVELGAGHGKMGFLVLTHLVRLREFWPAPGAFRYVLTDCCEQSLQFWAGHPSLQGFFKAGLCDYARFDAEKDTEIHLERAGITLKRGPTLCRPMIVLANYVFSALRQDYFQVFGGKGMPAPLLRAHCGLTWESDGVGVGDGNTTGESGRNDSDRSNDYTARPDDSAPKKMPESLDGCRIEWDYRAVEPDANGDDGPMSVYRNTDPVLGRILGEYVEASSRGGGGGSGKTRSINGSVSDGGTDYSLAIPLGATRCVRNIAKMCPGGRCLMIVGDKAWGDMCDLESTARDPHVVFHGSVSFMVNMHALRRYVEELGGFALRGNNASVGFKVEAYVVGGQTKMAFPKLRRKVSITYILGFVVVVVLLLRRLLTKIQLI